MTPELILGEPYKTTVDILSLGATIVEMADSAPSFADKSSITTMWAMVSVSSSD